MKRKTIVAMILIAAGTAAFVSQGIAYRALGPDGSSRFARMSTERTVDLLLPPILATIALLAGIALLLLDEPDVKPAATP